MNFCCFVAYSPGIYSWMLLFLGLSFPVPLPSQLWLSLSLQLYELSAFCFICCAFCCFFSSLSFFCCSFSIATCLFFSSFSFNKRKHSLLVNTRALPVLGCGLFAPGAIGRFSKLDKGERLVEDPIEVVADGTDFEGNLTSDSVDFVAVNLVVSEIASLLDSRAVLF